MVPIPAANIAAVTSTSPIAPGFKEFEVAPSQAHFGESIRRFKVLVGIALPLAPSFVRAIYSIPSFGNREIRRQRLPPRYQQKYQQNDRLQRGFANFY
jgi:hypothetical protein